MPALKLTEGQGFVGTGENRERSRRQQAQAGEVERRWNAVIVKCTQGSLCVRPSVRLSVEWSQEKEI